MGICRLYSVDLELHRFPDCPGQLYVDFFFSSNDSHSTTEAWLVISLNIKELCIRVLTTYYTQMFLLLEGWCSNPFTLFKDQLYRYPEHTYRYRVRMKGIGMGLDKIKLIGTEIITKFGIYFIEDKRA